MSCTARALPARRTSTKPRLISSQKCGMPPVWATTGPATNAIFPPVDFVSRNISAMRPTLASTRRSDETSLFMNANPSRSRALNSGTTRMPSRPHTTRSPARMSRSLRHECLRRIGHDRGIHSLLLDRYPPSHDAHFRPLVGRRIEVLRCAAVSIGGPDERIPLVLTPAAQRDELFEEIVESRDIGAVTFRVSREKSRSSGPDRNERPRRRRRGR